MIEPARFALVVVLLLTACGGGGGGSDSGGPGGQQPGDQPAIGESISGEATYFHSEGIGLCTYDGEADPVIAAISDLRYDNSSVCGMCVEVTGPKGTILVRIIDVCPGCASDDLDLSEKAFSLIAEPSQGRVPITWTPVACNTEGPLAIRFKEGSSSVWMAVQVRNSRIPVKRVEMMTGSGWLTLSQQSYNYHLNEDGPGPGPFSFRLTAIDGQQRVLDDIPLQAAQVVEGQGQFD